MLALLELVFFVRSKEVDCVFDELPHAYIHARLGPNSLTQLKCLVTLVLNCLHHQNSNNIIYKKCKLNMRFADLVYTSLRSYSQKLNPVIYLLFLLRQPSGISIENYGHPDFSLTNAFMQFELPVMKQRWPQVPSSSYQYSTNIRFSGMIYACCVVTIILEPCRELNNNQLKPNIAKKIRNNTFNLSKKNKHENCIYIIYFNQS